MQRENRGEKKGRRRRKMKEEAVKKNTEAAPQVQGHGHFVLSVDVIKAHSLVVMCA